MRKMLLVLVGLVTLTCGCFAEVKNFQDIDGYIGCYSTELAADLVIPRYEGEYMKADEIMYSVAKYDGLLIGTTFDMYFFTEDFDFIFNEMKAKCFIIMAPKREYGYAYTEVNVYAPISKDMVIKYSFKYIFDDDSEEDEETSEVE